VSIKDFGKKIKGTGNIYIVKAKVKGLALWKSEWSVDIFIVLVIVLVGIIGFGLGRLSTLEGDRQPLEIKRFICPLASSTPFKAEKVSSSGSIQSHITESAIGMLVASKSGTKYYFPWCSGVSRISEVNKVWYNSYEEAKAAGLTAASNCEGLK